MMLMVTSSSISVKPGARESADREQKSGWGATVRGMVRLGLKRNKKESTAARSGMRRIT